MPSIPNAVRLPLRFNAPALLAAVRQLDGTDWVRHFNTGYYTGDWTGVSLRSSNGGANQIFSPPNTEAFQDTRVLEQSPALAEALRQFRCELRSVRLLSLSPGSRIKEHSDYDLSVEDGEVRIHIPIQTNPDLEFFLDGERIVMREGEAWYLNLSLKHSVFNGGATTRIHLVVDCRVNEWLVSLIQSNVPTASVSGQDR